MGEDLSRSTVADLLRAANGADPAARLAATRELFRRGRPILAELEAAGAKPMRTISPRRGDVVYSLLAEIPAAGVSLNHFGIHVEESVRRVDVEQMGSRHGFHLDPSSAFSPQTAPACYVRVAAGKDIAGVFRSILTGEAGVRTVNFGYVEK